MESISTNIFRNLPFTYQSAPNLTLICISEYSDAHTHRQVAQAVSHTSGKHPLLMMGLQLALELRAAAPSPSDVSIHLYRPGTGTFPPEYWK